MSGVDDRIVRMDFQNSAFERAVGVTLGTLDKLKKSLDFGTDKKNALDAVQNSANRFSMATVGDQVQKATAHWNAWRAAGLIAFATVVHQAVLAGERVLRAFTIDPIKAGFENYETQINAVQTILANTGLTGAKGLGQVNTALAELNKYANQTVYNFSEMARNIGTFTAAGVDLKTSTASIKGIANLAALSGSTSDQASTAMYQLSQAIAANKVGLQDWNSVVNAGLGGKVFQQALFNTGKALGTIKGADMNTTFDQWTKAGNTFRGSLQSGWLTGKVLTQTLQGFTGDLTAAQLKAMGYTEAQIKQILKTGKVASDAATKIKTFSQLTQALKEEVASAYGAIFKTIFGDINQATTLFSGIHTVVENALTNPIYALNTLLEGADKLGARKDMIQGVKNVFQGLGSVLKPIKEAFRDIFPPITAKRLAAFVHEFENFTKILTVGKDTANNLRRTFRGVFALLDIGIQIISGVWHVVEKLFMSLSHGNGQILEVTGNIGDFLVRLDQTIKKSYGWLVFWDKLANVLTVPLLALKTLRDFIFGLFDGYDAKDVAHLEESMGRIGKALQNIVGAGDGVSRFFTNLNHKAAPLVHGIETAFANIGQAIGQAFSGTNLHDILQLVDTGLLAGIAFLIHRFLKSGVTVELGGGAFKAIKESFEGLTGTMKAMQTQLKAGALLKIAAAIALITISVVALSAINADNLKVAMKALAIGFGELLGAMAILTKISNGAGLIKMPLMAASLNLLATAIGILVGSVFALSHMSVEQLQKGLGAVAILLATVSAASIPLSANAKGMITASVGITAIAVALNILYFAVLGFSKLKWEELGRGLTGVAGSLAGIAAAMQLMPPGMLLQSVALIAIAAALNAIYFAVKNFSSLDWKTMGRGVAGLAGSLTAIAIAMRLMPKGILLQSAALIGVSVALQLIARAIGIMGKMSWTEIGKGLSALAGSLVVLAGGLYLMTGALPGAAALVVVSAGLALLVPVLKTLGGMSWTSIGKGLAALAGAFAVIGVAGLLLTPLIPVLLGLGVALTLVGTGMALAGTGALAFAAAFSLMAAVGTAGVAVMLKGLEGLIELLPTLGENLALGLVNFVTTIAKSAPLIVASFADMLGQLFDAVKKLSPKFGAAFTELLQVILKVLVDNGPSLIAAGFAILLDILQGVKDNLPEIVALAADIVVELLNGLTVRAPAIVAAGLNLVVALLNGIGKGASRIVAAAIGIVGSIITGIGNGAARLVSAGTGAVIHVVSGIGSAAGRIVAAGVSVILKFLSGLESQSVRLANGAFNIVVKLVNDLGDVARQKEPELIAAFAHLGEGIIEGIGQGIIDAFPDLLNSMGDKLDGLYGFVKGHIKVNSPSKVYMPIGSAIPEGMALGIKNSKHLENAMKTKLDRAALAVKKATLAAKIMDSIGDLHPTITPVLDLSDVKSKSAILAELITTSSKINPATTYLQARSVAADRATSGLTHKPVETIRSRGDIKFEQNNYSPKALSASEIFRNTRNQVALLKGVMST